MRRGQCLVAAVLLCLAATPSLAIEGSAAAGPTGGNDIRAALLPPPGVYGGGVLVTSEAFKFFDGDGNLVPAFSDLHLSRNRVAPFLGYVPDLQVLGGSIGIGAIVPAGPECGRLVLSTPGRCIVGMGDPYVEFAWSRYFGTARPSQYAGAYPIPEGLTLQLAFGMVIPIGKYDAADAARYGLAIGNNLWDFAPIIAATYVTRPIFAEGTEFSAKFYWNNYRTNPATHYSTGTLLDVDFAVTEHIGRVQVGVAGFYLFQVADDKLNGVAIPPDGHRARALDLGGVIACDMPEISASIKLKALTTVLTENAVKPYLLALSFFKKLD